MKLWSASLGVMLVGMLTVGCPRPVVVEESCRCTLGNWVKLSDPPPELVGRNNQVVEVVDGRVYTGLGGGLPGVLYRDWWMYDPIAESWERRADFPGEPRGLAMSFVINGKIYVVGGDSSHLGGYFQDGYVYDPATDTWSPMAPLPHPRSGGAGASDGRYGYIFGGAVDWEQNLSDILRYDPVEDRWDTLTILPDGGRWIPVLAYDQGALYLGLGRKSFSEYTRDLWRYDLSDGTWDSLPPHPYPVFDAWAVVMDGRLFILGGHTPGGAFTEQFYYFDLETRTWCAMAPFPGGPRNNLKGGAVRGKLYVGLGVTPERSFPVDWWVWTP